MAGINKLFGSAAGNIKSVDFTNSKIETFTNAFFGCTELQKITFCETCKELETGVLNDCTNLKQIVFEGTNPPIIEKQTTIENVIIEVPDGKEQAYQDALDVDNPGATVTAEEDILRYTSIDSMLSNKWLFDKTTGAAAKWSETEVPGEIKAEELWARFSWSGEFKGDLVSGTFDARIAKGVYEGIVDNMTGTDVFPSVGKNGELLVYIDKEQTLLFTIQPYSEISEKTEYTDQGYTYSFVNVEKPVYGKPTYEGVVVLKSDVTAVGDSAFDGASLTTIKLPQQITSIENNNTFRDCASLSSIDLPSGLTEIAGSAFAYCTSLASIDLPSSLTIIGNSTFHGCSSLTSIEIPDSVTTIGERAFSDCVELASIVVASDNNTFDSRNNCNAIINTKSNTLKVGCKNTIIPNSVESIGTSAFYECSGLTSINIPDSVTEIGDSAFYNCSNVSEVTCNATTPPTLSSHGDTFSGMKTSNCIVPEGSEQSYFNSYWALNFETFNGKYPDPYDPYDPYGY